MTFKLFKENKEQGLFIKTCVLPCSTDEEQYLDCRDQIYTNDEIATLISTEANNCFFDYNHEQEKLDGIYAIQNYQSKVEETINDVRIPVGSWIKIIFSENTFLNNKITNGKVRGVSNDFTIDTTKNYCKCNKELPPGTNTFLYEDVPEKECIIQTFLSFVDYPCNYMPLEAYDYEEYKLNNGDDPMKLKEAMKKIFNKKEESKEYDIENSEDVVRIINEITEEKLTSFKEAMETLFALIDEDIEFIKGDLQAVKDQISTVLGDEDSEEEEEDSGVQNSTKKKGGIKNKDEESEEESEDDDVSAKLDKILNRVEDLENKVENVKKQPVIKNKKVIKNLDKKQTGKSFLNRGK